jgi:D-lactate dehydrogenase
MTTSKRLLSSLGRMAARAAAHQPQQQQQQQAGSALAASAAAAARRAPAAATSVAATASVASAAASRPATTTTAAAAAAALAAAGPSRAFAAQAQAVEVQQQHRTATLTIPEVRADLFGAVSPVDPAADAAAQLGAAAQPFENADGKRHEDGRYARFADAIASFIPKERVFTDPVRTFAYGTDASFYRLNPRMVVKVHDEAEVRKMLPIAKKLGVPVTFRAAGTSLSGQAITDSVLIKLSHTGRNFRSYEIHVSFFV